MALRPATARWFELLVARDELGVALQRLAATGEVELQAHSDTSAATLLPVLRAAVDEYKRLAQRYAEFWPPASGAMVQGAREPEEIPAAALTRLRAWAVAADPVIDRLQKLAHERAELQLLERLLSAAGDELPDLHFFAQAGPILASRAYLLGAEPRALDVPPAVLVQNIPDHEWSYLLAVGPVEQIAVFDDTLSAHKARRFALPPELPALRGAAHAFTCARIEEITNESQGLETKLHELHRQHCVSAALADLAFIEWLVQNVPQLALTEHFAWITGWTSDLAGRRLEAVLDRQHLHYLLRFPDAPQGLVRPVVLRNPRWAQPFELFTRLLGMPGASEADTSELLAFVAPLMFGYMFADVGQGAVLVIAGVVLRRRFPATALLIPGGLAAIAFGFLFGSVFASEAILPALWLRPLDRPLVLLGVSLAFGACVILLGFALDAVQHSWSGLGTQWWATRAGLVLCYLGMICAPLQSRALWALPAGLGWYLIGSAVFAPAKKRLNGVAAAAGESLETLLQLAINTISFVRVGAFALAHAGLGSAVAGLAAATGSRPTAWLVLAAGNAMIIAIEGLVVGIQTTRLVLFEFFIRFLQGSGRTFRPLATPAAAALHPSSRT
jgi:V/A-type H+-transporting ATPase subunit I